MTKTGSPPPSPGNGYIGCSCLVRSHFVL